MQEEVMSCAYALRRHPSKSVPADKSMKSAHLFTKPGSCFRIELSLFDRDLPNQVAKEEVF